MWNLAPGGIELSVNHYIAHFADRRELNAFSLRTRENTLYDERRIRIASGGTVHSNLKIYWRYFQYCRNHRRDIFHLLYVGPVVVLISLLAGVQAPVYHIHGTIHWKSAAERWYVRTMWYLVSFFKVSYVANSGYSASIFHRDALPVHPRVIYNGLDTRVFLEKRRLRTRLCRIG